MRRAIIVGLGGGFLGATVLFALARRRRLTAPRDPARQRAEAPDHEVILPDVLVDPRILVEKGIRRLSVLADGAPVKTYRIALGFDPERDKEREGDGRTPEGEFYVCTKNPESRHRRSLGISYPNLEDTERGLGEGLITKRQHRSISEALRHYERPPWNTQLGGEIMIHGGGSQSDWTEGCIAVTDDEAQEIYDAIPLGTMVEIRA